MHDGQKDLVRAAALAFSLFASTVLTAQDPPDAPPESHYTVRATTARADEAGWIPLDVTLRVTAPPGKRTVFEIPIWTPGSYRIRVFPDRLRDLRAEDAAGNDLDVLRLRRNAWQVEHPSTPSITVRYRVLLTSEDRFMYAGDSRRCVTYEGPAVYLYPAEGKDRPCHVSFDLPAGWSSYSGLARRPDGTFYAVDYDVLADCPVKLGIAQTFTMASHGKPLHVVIDSQTDVTEDLQPWLTNITTVVDEAGAIFAGLPFAEYTFLFTVGPGGGGGLEHLTSTAIGLRRIGSPTAGISTIAHEFFHVWNVKRLRPMELGPFDYSRPGRTRGLWISEGFTSYYGPVLRTRAGLTDAAGFWRSMGAAIQSFESTPGRRHVTSREASEGVWSNQPNDRTLSYYTSGQVMALLLDLELRHRTNNTRGLDDFMVALYQLCEQHGRGFHIHEPALVASQLSGTDFRPWFDAYPGGTVVPDYEQVLGYAGVRYAEQRKVTNVLRGARAGRSGMMFADHAQLERMDTYSDIDPFAVSGELVSVDDTEITSQTDLEEIVAKHAPGDRLRVVFATASGRERAGMATIEERHVVRVGITLTEDASADQLAIREAITAKRR